MGSLCSPKWPLLRTICSLTSPPLKELEVCSTNFSRTSKTPLLTTTRKRTWPKRPISPLEPDSNNPSETLWLCNKNSRTISKKWPNASLKSNSSSPKPTRRSTETATSSPSLSACATLSWKSTPPLPPPETKSSSSSVPLELWSEEDLKASVHPLLPEMTLSTTLELIPMKLTPLSTTVATKMMPLKVSVNDFDL